MSENLVIRVGTTFDTPIHWAIWSSEAKTLIASGHFNHAEQLSELCERAQERTTTVLLPASACIFRQLSIPKKQRISAQTMLYQLEDELATDVEELHVVLCKHKGESAEIIAVEQILVEKWVSFFKEINLKIRTLLPDVLALPLEQDAWSGVALGEQWLIRQSQYQGFSVETGLLKPVLEGMDTPLPIVHYSPVAEQEHAGQWQAKPFELPMELLAKGAVAPVINLLTGPFRSENTWVRKLLPWRKVAIAVGVLCALSLTHSFVNIYQLEQQQKQLQTQINQTAKKILPQGTRLSNIRAQVTQHVQQITRAGKADPFLEQLTLLENAFKKTPALEIRTLSFDAASEQFTFTVAANSFESIEQFKSVAQEVFDVTVGEMTQQQEILVGTIRLKRLP